MTETREQRLFEGLQAAALESLDAQTRIAELESFVRDVRDNWDCDEDAHRHGTRCRACEAAKLLPKFQSTENG